MTILVSEGGDNTMKADADWILGVLCDVYPGHPWAVRVDQGVCFIKHLGIENHGYGMAFKYRDVVHDAAVFRREIIMKAGEWLERAGLVRGRENGDEIIRVDGLPEKYQPVIRHMDQRIGMSEIGPQGELRETPMPQVAKEINA